MCDAVDFVSGPAGVAAVLRTGLLAKPYNTPSLPLDTGWSDSIPPHIRRAVTLRDRHCAWQVILHPDGTFEARSPDGRQVRRSHAPPAATAA